MWFWQFLLIFDAFDSLSSTGKLFCGMSLHLGLSDFLWLEWDYEFLEVDHRGKIFLSHHIKGTYYTYDLSVVMLTLAEVVMWGFNTVKLLYSLLTYCTLWKEATIFSLPLRGQYFLPPRRWSTYINYLNWFTRKICLLPPIYQFSQLFIFITMDRIVGYLWNIEFTLNRIQRWTK